MLRLPILLARIHLLVLRALRVFSFCFSYFFSVFLFFHRFSVTNERRRGSRGGEGSVRETWWGRRTFLAEEGLEREFELVYIHAPASHRWPAKYSRNAHTQPLDRSHPQDAKSHMPSDQVWQYPSKEIKHCILQAGWFCWWNFMYTCRVFYHVCLWLKKNMHVSLIDLRISQNLCGRFYFYETYIYIGIMLFCTRCEEKSHYGGTAPPSSCLPPCKSHLTPKVKKDIRKRIILVTTSIWFDSPIYADI